MADNAKKGKDLSRDKSAIKRPTPDASSSNEQPSPEQTYTKQDVDKAFLDGKSEGGRESKPLREDNERLTGEISRLSGRIKELEDLETEALKNHPEGVNILDRKAKLDDRDAKLKKEEDNLNNSILTHFDELQKGRQVVWDLFVLEIANKRGVELSRLTDPRLGLDTLEKIDAMAETLATAKPASRPDDQDLDSGRSGGDAMSLVDLRGQDRIAHGLKLKKQRG